MAAGTYFENVTAKSDVNLKSESSAPATILDGSSAGSVIDCTGVSAGTKITGFTITHGAAEFGGGIRCWDGSSPLIAHNIFIDNTASYGGAIGCRYGSAPTVLSNTISRNVASSEGGGVYAIDGYGAAMVIARNHIRGNAAASQTSSSGGGVWLGAIDFEFRANWLSGNIASNGGGGIWAGFSGRKTIRDNVVWGNGCANLGGGAWVAQGFTTIESNVFYGNGAPQGGAIALGSGTMRIDRNILTSSTQGSAIFVNNQAADAKVDCNDLWANSDGDAIPATLTDGGHNFSADPLFCDVDAGDFHLQSDSPCLPANSPDGCSLIGALGFGGCNSISVKPDTWARVKARYR